MDRRPQLQAILEDLLGSKQVYFQKPENLRMTYPAIVYNHDDNLSEYSDNKPYRITKRWEVTVIDQDPDSVTSDKIAKLPMCTFTRSFPADNLNHYVYSLYF